jgi:hypothetical protein
MRHILTFTIIACLFCGCSGGGNKGAIQSRSEQELLASYLAFHQKKDLAGILSLFYLKDTPPFVIDSVKKRCIKNFAFTITSSRIEEIPPEKLKMLKAGLPFNGKTLVPNLEPIKQIAFEFAQTGQTEDMRAAGGSIMFGKIDNVCYFVLSKEKEAGEK